MARSPGPISPHHAGAPSRVIQGLFPGGRPRIVQASPAPAAPVRPQVPAPILARPGSPPAPLVPGRPASGALQPAPLRGQCPRPILPARVQLGALQPATPIRPLAPGPILPQPAAPAAVQPHAGDAIPLPANLTLKPRGSGQPLPEPVVKKMEAFFNTTFADVRVHVGHEAPSIGALAFTHGADLYFAPGQYNPQSSQGQQLLGHELTHVLQQRAGRVRNPLGSGVAVVQDPALEAEAERMGLRASTAAAPIQARPAGTAPIVAPRQAVGPGSNAFAIVPFVPPSVLQATIKNMDMHILYPIVLDKMKVLGNNIPSVKVCKAALADLRAKQVPAATPEDFDLLKKKSNEIFNSKQTVAEWIETKKREVETKRQEAALKAAEEAEAERRAAIENFVSTNNVTRVFNKYQPNLTAPTTTTTIGAKRTGGVSPLTGLPEDGVTYYSRTYSFSLDPGVGEVHIHWKPKGGDSVPSKIHFKRKGYEGELGAHHQYDIDSMTVLNNLKILPVGNEKLTTDYMG
jgi:hypothetical protein